MDTASIQKKERNLSLELLKFLSIFLIMNGHMSDLYTHFSIIATGGTIGNALFMFISGYTLLLGRFDRFDNWYKRRINRIYPSVIVWMIIMAVLYKSNMLNIKVLAQGGAKWFISCIMIYYAVLYIIRPLIPRFKWTIFFVSCLISIAWYLIMEDYSTFFMYRNTYFKYIYWFPFMLLGAYTGAGYIKFKLRGSKDAIIAFLCIVAHYAVSTICVYVPKYSCIQILSLIPLMGVTWFMFKLCEQLCVKEFLKNTRIGWWITGIASLCLEVYIVQENIFSTNLNHLFPLNIIMYMAFVILIAYIVRTMGRFFRQLWSSDDFNWKDIFRIV